MVKRIFCFAVYSLCLDEVASRPDEFCEIRRKYFMIDSFVIPSYFTARGHAQALGIIIQTFQSHRTILLIIKPRLRYCSQLASQTGYEGGVLLRSKQDGVIGEYSEVRSIGVERCYWERMRHEERIEKGRGPGVRI